MDESKKFKIKRIIGVVSCAVFILILVFCLVSWGRLNGAPIPYSDVIGTYTAQDSTLEISANELVFKDTDGANRTYFVDRYLDNVLFFGNDYLVVIDKDTLQYGRICYIRRYYESV